LETTGGKVPAAFPGKRKKKEKDVMSTCLSKKKLQEKKESAVFERGDGHPKPVEEKEECQKGGGAAYSLRQERDI